VNLRAGALRGPDPWKERTIRTLVTLLSTGLATVALLVYAGAASAHDGITNNGVTVEFHFAPDDDPVAGKPAAVVIESVAVRKGPFRWKTCRCALTISDSSGKQLYRKTPASRRTPFVFPAAGAYKVTFSGRVKRAGRWRSFTVSDAVRAS
jgi:hypothetical protein